MKTFIVAAVGLCFLITIAHCSEETGCPEGTKVLTVEEEEVDEGIYRIKVNVMKTTAGS